MKDKTEKKFERWFDENSDWLQERCCDKHSGSIYDLPASSCHIVSSGNGWDEPVIYECVHADDCPYLNQYAWDYFLDNHIEDDIEDEEDD